MKQEKFCVNKTIGLFAFVAFMALGIIFATSYINDQKLGTNSRASATKKQPASCSPSQCPGLDGTCYELYAVAKLSNTENRTCCPARMNPDYIKSKRDKIAYATWSETGDSCVILGAGVVPDNPAVVALPLTTEGTDGTVTTVVVTPGAPLPAATSTTAPDVTVEPATGVTTNSTMTYIPKCESGGMYVFIPNLKKFVPGLLSDVTDKINIGTGNMLNEFGAGIKLAFDGEGWDGSVQKGTYDISLKIKLEPLPGQNTNLCTVTGVDLPGVGFVTLNPNNDFGNNAGFAKLTTYLLQQASSFAYAPNAGKTYTATVHYTNGKTTIASLDVSTRKIPRTFVGYKDVDQGLTALQTLTFYNPYTNKSFAPIPKIMVIAAVQEVMNAIPLSPQQTTNALEPIAGISVYGKTGVAYATLDYEADSNPMTLGAITNVVLGGGSDTINFTLNPKAADSNSVTLNTIFNGAGGNGNYILQALNKYGKLEENDGTVTVNVPFKLEFTDGHMRKGTLNIKFVPNRDD